jgi:hypothetical protein
MRMEIQKERAPRPRRLRPWSGLVAAGLVALGWLASAAAQDIAAGTFAAAIRASGHPCERVIESASKGDSVWHVRCNAGWYEVTKKGDSTFQVVPLE